MSSVGVSDCAAIVLVGHNRVLSTTLHKSKNFPQALCVNFFPSFLEVVLMSAVLHNVALHNILYLYLDIVYVVSFSMYVEFFNAFLT